MEPRTEIRSCREEDLDEVCAIEKRNFPSPNPGWWFERLLFQKPGAFLVAVERKDVLGFAVAVIEMNFRLWGFRFDKWAHLMDLAVREGKRREGIGTALIKGLANRVKGRGINCIKLEVRGKTSGRESSIGVSAS